MALVEADGQTGSRGGFSGHCAGWVSEAEGGCREGGKKEGISRKKSFGGCAKDWGGLFSACGSRAGGFEVLCVVEKRL